MYGIGRPMAYAALVAALLICLLGNASAPSPQPATATDSASHAAASDPGAAAPLRPTCAPATAALPAEPLPTVELPSSVPAVLAQIPFAQPGDAYGPVDVAADAGGRAIVLCARAEGPWGTGPALVAIDPRTGSRGPLVPLPLRRVRRIVFAGDRALVEYETSTPNGHEPHLAAVDPETGGVLGDLSLAGMQSEFVAGADGRLYLPMETGLEVHDAVTLAPLCRVPFPSQGPLWYDIVMDPQGEQLYLLNGKYLRSYRAEDLRFLWQIPGPLGLGQQLVVDAAGRYIYCWYHPYSEDGWSLTSCLQAYEADSGTALEPVHFSSGPDASGIGPAWLQLNLLTADSEQGYLLFQNSEGALWKVGFDGRSLPAGREAAGAQQGRVFVPSPSHHLVSIYSVADLRLEHRVVLGIEIEDVMVDPDQGRLYVADSAGTVHVLDARDYRRTGSVEAGTDLLAVDGPSHLLFVAQAVHASDYDVAVVDTSALTVTGHITGGNAITVDSAGHRAFAGLSYGETVQVWDTRTFSHLGTIPYGGAPTYNPLRDELYLPLSSESREPGPVASILDGRSLTVTGKLRFPLDVDGFPQVRVSRILFDAREQVITAEYYDEDHWGFVPEPPLLSARTLEPLTHTLTVLDYREAVVLPAEDGRVYGHRSYVSRYGRRCDAFIWRAGTDEVIAERQDLCLDFVLPGTHVGLEDGTFRPGGKWRAFDLRTWGDLGPLGVDHLQVLDPVARRIYAWEDGSTLTVLAYGD